MPARCCVAASACFLALSVAAVAQSPAGPSGDSASALVRTELFASLDGQPVIDLASSDVQLLEDGAPQTIEAFDLVRPREGDAPGLSVVVFVDTLHTALERERPLRLALARALEEGLTPRDRIALTSPERVASELRFVPVAEAVSLLSQPDWTWVRLSGVETGAAKDALYDGCFAGERGGREVADELKARRRERTSLDALDALVAHLEGMRLGRTVLIVAGEGWRLFGEKADLARPRRQGTGVETPFGRFGGGGRPARPAVSGVSRVECEADLRDLARLDHGQRARELSEAGNRALITFVPVSAAGLGGQSMGGSTGAATEAGLDSLRFLADNTGGTAVTTPATKGGLVAVLTAEGTPYYLVRFRSTNAKLDGRFRALTVRTTRPGLRVRVRRGYRGATAEELLSGRDTVRRGGRDRDGAVTEPRGVSSPSFRIRTAAWAGTEGGAFWVVGELDQRLRRELIWTAAATAEIVVLSGDGREVLSRTIDVSPAEPSFSLRVPAEGDVPAGDYAVRIRVSPEADPAIVLSDTARVALGRAPRGASEPLVWRRGPSTGPRFVQTAAVRFQRQDRLRLEFATRLDGAPAARLLDRAGEPLQVPVTLSSRTDSADEGVRWIVAELALAPLALGEYQVEIDIPAGGQHGFTFTMAP